MKIFEALDQQWDVGPIIFQTQAIFLLIQAENWRDNLLKVMGKPIPRELSGVFAALPTPQTSQGDPLWAAHEALVAFALERGLQGLCLGGATGEYLAASVSHRAEMFTRVARQAKGKANLICAIGAEHAGQVRQLAQAAADCGAIALLFPPPAFLPYARADMLDFLARVAADLPLPVLIYHIPQCTRDLGIAGVLHLIASVPNIIGLKDSSGQKSNLAVIAEAQKETPFAFLAGSDDLFLPAFEHGAVGAISGIAAACPELLLALYESVRGGTEEQARAWQARVDEFIRHAQDLPAAWAVKLALQVRGLDVGALAWPMSSNLAARAGAFQSWFAAHSAADGTPHPLSAEAGSADHPDLIGIPGSSLHSRTQV